MQVSASRGNLQDLQRTVNVFESGSGANSGSSRRGGGTDSHRQQLPQRNIHPSVGLMGAPPRKDLDALLLQSLKL